MTLVELAAQGQVAATVRSVDVADGHRLRLAELGIRPGATMRILRKASGGGYIVGLGTSRIALDKATCAHIIVGATA